MGIKIVDIIIPQETWCKILERDCVELMKLSKGETVLSCSPPIVKGGNVMFTLEVDDPTFDTTLSVRVGEEKEKEALSMQDYQLRVIDEERELDEKRMKLLEFMTGAIFETLEEGEKDRLARQLISMTSYSLILGERIAAFK